MPSYSRVGSSKGGSTMVLPFFPRRPYELPPRSLGFWDAQRSPSYGRRKAGRYNPKAKRLLNRPGFAGGHFV